MSKFFGKIKSLFARKAKETSVTVDEIWKDDLIDRKRVAINFSKFISSLRNQHKIIFIDSLPGYGKTFFLKRWALHLRCRGEIAVYYNVWNNNLSDDAFVPFIDFVFNELFAVANIKPKTAKKLALLSQSMLSMNTLNKLISKSPLGVLSVFFEAAQSAFQTSKSGFSVDEDIIYKQKKTNIEKFKTQFLEVIQTIRTSDQNIYILVDDLDQCYPKLALNFLEQIKYIFDIPGFIFILASQVSRVEEAFISVCGKQSESILSSKYIDYKLELPQVMNLNRYISNLEQKFSFNQILSHTNCEIMYKNILLDSFRFYCHLFPISLIEMQRALNRIRLIIPFVKYLLLPNLLAFLVLLRGWNKSYYVEIDKYSTLNEIEEFLDQKIKPLFENQIQEQREWERLLISFKIGITNVKDKSCIYHIIGDCEYEYFIPDNQYAHCNYSKIIQGIKNLIEVNF